MSPVAVLVAVLVVLAELAFVVAMIRLRPRDPFAGGPRRW